MLEPAERVRREAIIAKDYGGIFPAHEAFYIQSLIYAAGRAEDAFDRFDRAIEESGDPELIVATIQEALTHTAALSRFFWPTERKGLAPARGEKLRDAFDIRDDSPLRHRKLRNAFEHFDEHLDAFLLRDPVGYFFPSALVNDHSLADEQVTNVFKLVDPVNAICVLLGEKYQFGDLRSEALRILTTARTMNATGSRLKKPKPREQR